MPFFWQPGEVIPQLQDRNIAWDLWEEATSTGALGLLAWLDVPDAQTRSSKEKQC
jgi:hypothetical protein